MRNNINISHINIWLDLRFLKNLDRYSKFIAVLIQYLINIDTTNNYKLYLNEDLKIKFPDNINVKYIKEKPGSFLEQIKFNFLLKKDNNSLMIFFNEKKPLLYKWKYLLFIKDLKELHYKKQKSNIVEKIENLFLNTSLKDANRVICFDNQTLNELNEKLNISENKLEILYPFFLKDNVSENEIITNIKTKFSIKWEYFVYSWWNWNNKNLSKLIEVISKLNKRKQDINLIILDQNLTEDINFRNDVVRADIVKKIFFIWDTTLEEKKAFYNEAIWTIFPSLYESFPFDLTESITYNSPILSSWIKQIKEIMWDSIVYFSPVSSIDMIEAIEIFVEKWKKEVNYENIFTKLSPEKSSKELLKIIQKV
jgi:glycosyltransferase involved in cell wall biosynthesis